MSATLDPRPVIGVERGWYIVALWNVLHLKFGVKLYSGIITGRSDGRSFTEVVSPCTLAYSCWWFEPSSAHNW